MSTLDTAEKWEEVCRQTCIQAAFIRVAALWAEEVKGRARRTLLGGDLSCCGMEEDLRPGAITVQLHAQFVELHTY